MRKIGEYQDPEVVQYDFKLLADMVKNNPAGLADLLLLFNNILIAKKFNYQKLADATGLDKEIIKKNLLPSNKNPDENVLIAVMKAAGFDLKNWLTTKMSLEKITNKYDEVLKMLSKT